MPELVLALASYTTSRDTTRVRLDYADLTGAQLTDSILIGAQIHRRDAWPCKLMGADLRGAVLSGVDLTNADFRNTTWAGAKSGAPPPQSFLRHPRRPI
ncbi:hypothetical protein CNY89_23795 [Amaricoccus sp. HAR-UPW-R2A-40]|nr:hypothetical protein CNY89_23795 [Amaricoccus sp. HAR-UPW-R2A-40]